MSTIAVGIAYAASGVSLNTVMSQEGSPGPPRYSPGRDRSYSRSLSRSPTRRHRSYSPDGRRDSGNDEPVSTIYVGGISFDTNEKALEHYFEKFGNVIETKVVIDRETGRSKGYGFVKFDDTRDASDAITSCHGKLLDGRSIRCNMAKYNPGTGGPMGPPAVRGYGPPGYSGGRGRGGEFSGPPGGRGYSDGYPGGRGGRFEGGGRGGRGLPYGGRGGQPLAADGSGRYAPPSDGRGRSRSYSPDGSAPSKRRRSPDGSHDGTPREGRAHKRRGPPAAAAPSSRRSKYSTSPSLSYSPSVSRSVSRSPRGRRQGPGAHSEKDHGTSRKKEGELLARLEALEAKNRATTAASRVVTEQLADLTTTHQKSEATHKLYRRWMSALLESSQAHLEAKEDVKAAELEYQQRGKDLMQLLTEADAFLTEERRERRKQKKVTDGSGGEAGDAVPAETDTPTVKGAPLPKDEKPSGDVPTLPHNSAPGWSEAAAVPAPSPMDAAGRFAAGAKFTINT